MYFLGKGVIYEEMKYIVKNMECNVFKEDELDLFLLLYIDYRGIWLEYLWIILVFY